MFKQCYMNNFFNSDQDLKDNEIRGCIISRDVPPTVSLEILTNLIKCGFEIVCRVYDDGYYYCTYNDDKFVVILIKEDLF